MAGAVRGSDGVFRKLLRGRNCGSPRPGRADAALSGLWSAAAAKGLALALCRPPVRQLIDDVAQVCKREDICLDQKIATLVGDADPTHLGRFVAMMSGQTHSVLYLRPKTRSSTDWKACICKGSSGRFSRSRPGSKPPSFWSCRTCPPPPLGRTGTSKLSTQDPQVARAERRGLQIIEKLLDIQFPGGQKLKRDQVLHWVYSFFAQEARIPESDDMPPVEANWHRASGCSRIGLCNADRTK